MEKRITVQVPGMSKADLADMLGGIKFKDPRFKAVENKIDSKLNADPATIALMTTVATVAVEEMVKAATDAFIEWLKHKKKGIESSPKIQVTFEMTLGGKKTATITSSSAIKDLIIDFPTEAAEISCFRMQEVK